ncbi:MAG: hypothetical protein ACRDSK_07920 [Actinophytocola sp.]|uniref:hypothetical protein n=1 Tax=Actinophytocola sp. TaxID=1872138 RepID=UPI003D6B7B74
MSSRVLIAAWLTWPAGLLLALAYAMGQVIPTTVFAVFAVAYVGAALLLLRTLDGSADRPAAALVLAGVGIFVLAGATGEPTAREPALMLLNAAVLAAVAMTLLVAATRLALRCESARAPAALAVLALVVGSGGYLINLVARWAVVLSGSAGLQLEVESSSWVAYAYLPGLDSAPTFLGFLLVLLDLLQLTYVVLGYVGFAALAVALGRAGALSAGASQGIAMAGFALAAVAGGSAMSALLLPGVGATVAGWSAFVLTIPFMSTLLPFALGVGLLRAHRARPAVGDAKVPALDPQGARRG